MKKVILVLMFLLWAITMNGYCADVWKCKITKIDVNETTPTVYEYFITAALILNDVDTGQAFTITVKVDDLTGTVAEKKAKVVERLKAASMIYRNTYNTYQSLNNQIGAEVDIQ